VLASRAAAELAAETAERDTGELLDRFEEERTQRDLAADGTAATFQALARSQADVLLLEDRSEDGRTAWFGGPASRWRWTGRDAPQDPRRPSEGLGALLRFATP
jgi:hypothetical protein